MKRARIQQGSVVFDKRRKTWNFLWCDDGHRRTKLIGSVREFPTKTAACQKAESFSRSLEKQPASGVLTVNALAELYKSERLPSRYATARVYCYWLRNHILPKWGETPITEIQPRPVELWLRQLRLSPKSKSHVRNLLRVLVEYAMWSGLLEISRNPIDLVVVKGATTRSLTVEQSRGSTYNSGSLSKQWLSYVCVWGLGLANCLL